MLKQIKKITALALIILLGGSLLIPTAKVESAPASFPEITSQAAVLMEFSRGEILFSQNGSEQMPPASLTKIITLLMAFEARENGRVSWDDEVVISEKAWKTGGSQMFLNVGEKVAVKDLVTGIAVVSANDACVALAEHLSGLEASFVQEMNNKARELNLKNTRFENASGLPHPDHYSTAEDIALLSYSLINKYPEVLDLYSQKEFTFNGISQMNRNPLLGRFPGADGLKTGHTSDAGYCLAGTAEQNGMRFISVIINSPSEAIRQKDSEALLNFAFRNYCLETVFTAGEIVATAEVSKGEEREIQLEVGNDVQVVIPYDRKEDLKIRLDVPEIVASPVAKEAPLGKVQIILDGAVLKEEPLLASNEVARAGYLTLFWRSLSGFVSSLWKQLIEKIQNILP